MSLFRRKSEPPVTTTCLDCNGRGDIQVTRSDGKTTYGTVTTEIRCPACNGVGSFTI